MQGAAISPPEFGQDPRWAHPRPPLEKGRLREYGYPRGGVPSLKLQPVLADKLGPRPYGGAAELSERGLPRELPKLEQSPQPHSARESRSTSRPSKRSKQGSQTAREHGDEVPPRREVSSSSFLKMVLELGDSVLEEKNLQRLEAKAGSSKKLAEIVRLLRSVADRVQQNGEVTPRVAPEAEHPVPPARGSEAMSLESHQLAAQASFLERKILKLREKLKRRARETSQAPAEAAEEAGTLEELLAEVEALRAEKMRLESEKEAMQRTMTSSSSGGWLASPGRDSSRPRAAAGTSGGDRKDEALQAKAALQKRLHHLQTQMRERVNEKEAADRNAEEAKRLAETVEARLRDMVLTRESERVKLEAAQELLRRKVEEQARLLREMEGSSTDGNQLDELHARVAALEQELQLARDARAKRQRLEQQQDEEHRRKEEQAEDGEELQACADGPEESPAEASEEQHDLDASEEVQKQHGDKDSQDEDDVEREEGEEEQLKPAEADDEVLEPDGKGTADDEENEEQDAKEDGEQRSQSEGVEQEQEEEEGMRASVEERNAEGDDVQIEADSANAGEAEKEGHDQLKQEDEAEEAEAKEEEAEEQVEEEDEQDLELKAELKQLERELVSIQAEGRKEEWQRRRQFTADMERRRGELDDELEAYKKAIAAAADQKGFLVEVQHGLDTLASRQDEELAQVRKEGDEKVKALEVEVEELQAEVAKDRLCDELLARRQREMCGKCFIALRPAEYRPDEVLQYLRCSLDLPSDRVQIVEECLLPPATPCSEIMTTLGQPLPSTGMRNLDGQDGEEDVHLLRLTVNILGMSPSEVTPHDPRSDNEFRDRASLAKQLMQLIQQGGSLLEDVAVVGANYLRGFSALDAEGERWDEQAAEFVTTAVRQIGKRSLHMTVHRQRDPTAVRIIAIEHGLDEEFILCFDDNDIAALLGEASLWRRRPELGHRLIDLLLDSLRIVDGPAGKPVLLGLQVVQAPETILNAAPALHGTPVPAERVEETPQPQAGVAESASVDTPALQDPAVDDAQGAGAIRCVDRPVFEDVLMLGDGFFTLVVFEDAITHCMRVRLQAAGACEAVEAQLPARADGGKQLRQLRVHAEAYEFSGMTVILLIEDIDVPPGLLIRVGEGGLVSNQGMQITSEQHIYHLVQVTDDDGGLAYLPGPLGQHGTTVSMIPSQHRELLRRFAQSDPPRSDEWSLREPRAKRNQAQVGVAATNLQLADAATTHTTAAKVRQAEEARKRLEATAQVTTRLRPLLKIGRRLSKGSTGESVLCVLTFVEVEEPFHHLTVTAHELGSCCSWFMLVDSLNVFKVLGVRLAAGSFDLASRRALAAGLAEHCTLLEDADTGFKLSISKSRGCGKNAADRGEGLAVSFSRQLALTGSNESTAPGIAQQELSQDESARWIAEERDYCVVQALLNIAGSQVDVHIFDEPGVESVIFSLNNFLVVAHDAQRAVYFSMRLHDRVLSYPLQEEERYLLEPENHKDLLRRVLASLDLCNSVDQHGIAGERLVMQQEALRHVPPLVPDADGVLHPMSFTAASGPFADTTMSYMLGESLALSPSPTSEVLHKALEPVQITASSFASKQTSALLTMLPMSSSEGFASDKKPAYIGGGAIALGSRTSAGVDGSTDRGSRMFAQEMRTWGNVEVELTVFLDELRRAFVFRLMPCGQTGRDDAGLEVQLSTGGDPTRMYLEHRTFLGEPIAIAMAERAFPHELQVFVFNPKSHQEMQITARSDLIQPLIERSSRARLSDALEELFKNGTLMKDASQVQTKEVAAGREIFPPDFRERSLQQFVPIVAVPLEASPSGEAQEQGDEERPVSSKAEVIFACTRLVLNSTKLGLAIEDPEYSLEDAPVVKVTLLKEAESQDFALHLESVQNCGEGPASHTIRIRDKAQETPLGAFGEIQKVGELRFLFLFLDDPAPRALRVAIVELASGWSWQMIAVNTQSAAASAGTYLSACPQRLDLLRLFRSSISVRRGVPVQGVARHTGGFSTNASSASAKAASSLKVGF